MLVPDRRTILLLKADAEAVERLDVPRTARVRMQVASSSSVEDNVSRPGRRPGTVVVTTGALGDPRTGDLLAGLSLAGVRVVRPHEYYERVLRRVSLEDIDESWFLFHRGARLLPAGAGRAWRHALQDLEVPHHADGRRTQRPGMGQPRRHQGDPGRPLPAQDPP